MIMAGFTLVGCLLATLSPFKVCFSQFNGSPICHTLAVPTCLPGWEVIYYPCGNDCAEAVIWLKENHSYLENSIRENKG